MAQTAKVAPSPAKVAQAAVMAVSVIGQNGEDGNGLTPDNRLFSIPLGAIGVVRCKPREGGGVEVIECRAAGQESMEEGELLSRFLQGVNMYKPRIVSFGGSHFGLPLIRYRSMVHGLSAPHLAANNGPLGLHPTPGQDIHLDLARTLSCDGTTVRPTLNDLCMVLGTSADLDTGSPRRRATLEAAVIFMGYLRFQLFTGAIDIDQHTAGVESLDNAIRRSPDIHS